LYQEDDELFAAESADQVVGLKDADNTGGHRAEHVVTDKVAIGVVDGLEVVEIEDGETEGGFSGEQSGGAVEGVLAV
jgi:hypothetical protein